MPKFFLVMVMIGLWTMGVVVPSACADPLDVYWSQKQKIADANDKIKDSNEDTKELMGE